MSTGKLRILVAPDSFKGSLSAKQAATIIADALDAKLPNAEIVQCPLADGGEGTKAILKPQMPDNVYLIESAEFVGLNLPEMASLDVMNRGSNPIGDAILAGLDDGKREFVIGLGGSATNDCGLGMLLALGMQAWDADHHPVEPNLFGLLAVDRIDLSGLDPRLSESRFTILSDVLSPLCGKNGATAVYGPQKGVQRGEVRRIDRAISGFADMCGDAFGFDPRSEQGAGAAGGLGMALMLIGGKMVSGASFVMNKTGLHHGLVGAEWVITGEGRSDAQTLQGKLPLKVAQAARAAGVKVALLSGSVDADAEADLKKHFDLVIGTAPAGITIEQVMEKAGEMLIAGVHQLIERVSRDR